MDPRGGVLVTQSMSARHVEGEEWKTRLSVRLAGGTRTQYSYLCPRGKRQPFLTGNNCASTDISS